MDEGAVFRAIWGAVVIQLKILFAVARFLVMGIVQLYNSWRKHQLEVLHNSPPADLPPQANEACERAVHKVLDCLPEGLAQALKQPARQLCSQLLSYDRLFHNRQLSTQKGEEIVGMFVYNLLHDKQRRLWLDGGLIDGGREGATFAIPLHTLHANVAQAIESVGGILGQECKPPDGQPFPRLWKKFSDNCCWASGIDPDEIDEMEKRGESRLPKEPVMPSQVKGKSPSELVQLYLRETPFSDFFNTSLSVSLPISDRFSHMHIVGGSGHGKTQLMQRLILEDLDKVQLGNCSLIVIDSQGDMFKNIQSLAAVGAMAERVVIIDPTVIESPPALNLFDFGQDRLDRYNAYDREVLFNGAIALYEYMFGALLSAELTSRQSLIFRYLARLMMHVPRATMRTMIDFMDNPEAVRPYLSKLDDTAAHFFQTQFFSKTYDDTRQQIAARLWRVLEIRVLERMFANERNKVNLFDAMNRGSLILINTAKDLLKQEGCEIFGRFFIALICQAAQERASIPENQRKDTFVYIDEAHDYFDESIENLLTQARKYQVGLVLAHQFLDQFDTRLHKAVKANTAIKMVGGLSNDDARSFAREMGCEPEFLQSMRKQQNSTQFACFIRNRTTHPLPLTVPLGQMEHWVKLTPEEQASLKEQNRRRFCGTFAHVPASSEKAPDQAGFTLEKPELL